MPTGGRARPGPGHTFEPCEAPLYVGRSGRRWQPTNVAHPPRARPPRTSAMTWAATPRPVAAIGIRRTQLGSTQPRGGRRGCYSHTGAACAVVVSCPFPGFFGAGWKGLAPRNRRPPTRCGQPPPCPRLVCAVGGVGAAGNGPPRGTPPHPICCAGCLRCTCGLQIDYQGVGVIGRPPVGAPGRIKTGCTEVQVLFFPVARFIVT